MAEEGTKADAGTIAGSLTDHLSDYAETYLKLGAVHAVEKGTGVASVTVAAIALSVFCLFVLLFAGLGVAVWLGEIWSNVKAGYFAVAGFYSVFTLLFLVLRKRIIFPMIRNHFIRKVYE